MRPYRVSDGGLLREKNAGGDITGITFSPDGTMLVVGTENAVQFFTIPGLTRFYTIEEPDWCTALQFTPDGQMLIWSTFGGDIKFWDLRSQSLVRTISTGDLLVPIYLSPDGRVLLSVDSYVTDSINLTEFNFWSVTDGSLLLTYPQDIGQVIWDVRFSPDGRLFAWGRDDGFVVARNPFWQVGDVNGDGCVDANDLSQVLSDFGNTGPRDSDLNGDEIVEDRDLSIALFNFGQGC